VTAKAPNFYIVDYLLGLPAPTLDGLADTDASFGRMIYREGSPVKLENSGKRAIVVVNTPGVVYPGSNGSYGSVVNMRLLADHTRDVDGLADVEDGVDRAWAMFGLLDKLLNVEAPIIVTDPWIQTNRVNQPLETWDPAQNVTYDTVCYDVSVLGTT